MANKVGDQPIEGYTIESLLGHGTYGDVWKAVGPDNLPCALKFVNLSGVSPKELRLPRAMMAVRHPNLCPILGLWMLSPDGAVLVDGSAESINLNGTMNTRLVFAMGLGQKSLAQRLEECLALGGIPIRELIRYMGDAAQGIDHLHNPAEGTPGFVHGSIKPSNMLLVGDLVQVCDYGLARLDMGKRGTQTFSSGAPIYSSPEAINDEPIKASDQYSLAISYYQLRTALLPFEESKAMISNLTGVLDFSALADSEIKVLERATHKNPLRRYANCSEMVAELRKVVELTRDWQREETSGSLPSRSLASTVAPPSRPFPPPPMPATERSTGTFVDDYPGMLDDYRKTTPGTPAPAKPAKTPPPVTLPAPTAVTTKTSVATFADSIDDLDLDPTPTSWSVGAAGRRTTSRARTVEGQATVRYYSGMNPERLFPLLVAFTEQQIKQIVQKSVSQAVSSKLAVEEGSLLEVEPILPGCDVYPPLASIPVTSSTTEALATPARFYVLPRLLGRVEDARVVIRQGGVTLAEVPLSIVVRRQRLSYLLGAFGLVSPYLMTGLKALNLDPENQRQLGFPLYQQIGSWFTETVRPEWVVIGSLVLAVLVYLWCRPRRQTAFWELEKAT